MSHTSLVKSASMQYLPGLELPISEDCESSQIEQYQGSYGYMPLTRFSNAKERMLRYDDPLCIKIWLKNPGEEANEYHKRHLEEIMLRRFLTEENLCTLTVDGEEEVSGYLMMRFLTERNPDHPETAVLVKEHPLEAPRIHYLINITLAFLKGPINITFPTVESALKKLGLRKTLPPRLMIYNEREHAGMLRAYRGQWSQILSDAKVYDNTLFADLEGARGRRRFIEEVLSSNRDLQDFYYDKGLAIVFTRYQALFDFLRNKEIVNIVENADAL